MDHPGLAYPTQSILRPCPLLKSYDLCVDETLGFYLLGFLLSSETYLFIYILQSICLLLEVPSLVFVIFRALLPSLHGFLLLSLRVSLFHSADVMTDEPIAPEADAWTQCDFGAAP